jgi:6-phosphogluconolactonase
MSNYVYVSSGAHGGKDRVLTFRMDHDTGKLRDKREMPFPSGGPGPLAVDPHQRFMYVGLRRSCEISSFRVDRSTGLLSPITKVSLEADPCYIATDRRGRFLLAAYYGAGKVTVHAIDKNGGVGRKVEEVSTAEHAHCFRTDPSNRFAYVSHTMPSNVIFQFFFDEASGALKPNAFQKIIPEEVAGPRHFDFLPGKNILYFSNEQGNSVTAYRLDPSAGTLTAFQTISTLPINYSGSKEYPNWCAKIHVHPSGRFLYVSNRGYGSIACFSINRLTGYLTSLGQQRTEPIPRAFNLDPAGNFLFAAGQKSGRLEAFRVDPQAGTLKPLELYTVGVQCMWVLILNL